MKRPLLLRFLLARHTLSPLWLLGMAGTLVLVFLIFLACGLREYTTLVTGTSPDGGRVTRGGIMLAMAYVGGYLGAVVVAPIMALAAVLWTAGLLVVRRPRPT